ncbi:MAG: hypothetical protein NUV50_04395, partial [Rhodospirillales bacterium]|nr:hypothetical protein [Rhodospirillales bacterium]
PKGCVLTFRANQFPNPLGLVHYINDQVGTVKLRPDQKLVIKRAWNSGQDRLNGVAHLVKKLAAIAHGVL